MTGERQPRVLHAIHDFLPRHRAGSEIYAWELCRALAPACHVSVLAAEHDLQRVLERVLATNALKPIEDARGLRVELAHPAAGKVALTRSPMRFSATPVEHERPPPLLGQHTEEVLRGLLDLKDDEVAKLRADGAV